jgi:hypothetical protein
MASRTPEQDGFKLPPEVDLNATNSTNSLNSSEFGFARPERLKSLVALPW